MTGDAANSPPKIQSPRGIARAGLRRYLKWYHPQNAAKASPRASLDSNAGRVVFSSPNSNELNSHSRANTCSDASSLPPLNAKGA